MPAHLATRHLSLFQQLDQVRRRYIWDSSGRWQRVDLRISEVAAAGLGSAFNKDRGAADSFITLVTASTENEVQLKAMPIGIRLSFPNYVCIVDG